MRRAPFFLMFVLAILVALFAYGHLRAAGIPTAGKQHMETNLRVASIAPPRSAKSQIC